MAAVKTLEDAYEFVQAVGICTLFSGKVKGVTALWDVVDLPESGGGRTRWGARVEAIWAWKNELPTVYPDDVYYGKVRGGHAALMSMEHLRKVHFPKFHKPVGECGELARKLFGLVRLNGGTTSEIRNEAMEQFGCTKSRFESAFKELQVSLNIVRLNEPDLTQDTWVPFAEVYEGFDEEGVS